MSAKKYIKTCETRTKKKSSYFMTAVVARATNFFALGLLPSKKTWVLGKTRKEQRNPRLNQNIFLRLLCFSGEGGCTKRELIGGFGNGRLGSRTKVAARDLNTQGSWKHGCGSLMTDNTSEEQVQAEGALYFVVNPVGSISHAMQWKRNCLLFFSLRNRSKDYRRKSNTVPLC